MKRPKKAVPIIKQEVVTREQFRIKCPHCGTILANGFSREILRFLCGHCEQPIDIDWEAS